MPALYFPGTVCDSAVRAYAGAEKGRKTSALLSDQHVFYQRCGQSGGALSALAGGRKLFYPAVLSVCDPGCDRDRKAGKHLSFLCYQPYSGTGAGIQRDHNGSQQLERNPWFKSGVPGTYGLLRSLGGSDGADDLKGGALGGNFDLYKEKLNHYPDVIKGILKNECSSLLSNYFKKKRNK